MMMLADGRQGPSRLRESLVPDDGRVPHISLVFREMWDTADVDR
jgi:hypothetical protein